MMDYTETYTDPNIKLDNGDPVLLWIRYQGSNKGNCTITIKGAYNPLPLNKMVVPWLFKRNLIQLKLDNAENRAD